MAATSMKDVAKAAGVSIGTVSHVLNHPERVKPTTRAIVEAVISELGFVRNESARQLKAGQSRTLAYVALDAGNPFFTDVARGMQELARERGLALFLCNSDGDPSREEEYLDLLLEHRVRGVLITAMNYNNPRLRALPSRGVPVVLVDRMAGDGGEFCCVGVNDREGGSLAAMHLMEQGHSRIGFVGGPMTISQVSERLEGVIFALREAGVSELLSLLEIAALTVDEGRLAAQRLLGLPESRRPTAVVCANDLVALGMLQGLTQQGVSVPGDIAIVGYDDIEYAAAAAVPLTSVRQPRQLLGRTAVDLLLTEADWNSESSGEIHQHRQVVFQPELIVRESSLSRRTQPGRKASERTPNRPK